jgi:hypothetical protein
MFLCANKINDAGAQALAMLKDSTTLGTLSLRCNEIGHAGVQALAMLKGSNTSSSRADDSPVEIDRTDLRHAEFSKTGSGHAVEHRLSMLCMGPVCSV